MTAPDSFRSWLREQVQQVLKCKTAQPPFLLWCDPGRVWRELLAAAADGGEFELWADDIHELLLRDRFCKAPRSPRVVWVPTSRADLSYFKVFELEADTVWELTLVAALTHYGVDIPHAQLPELGPLLPAHAREWLDRPKATWKELTYASAKGTLIDEDLILETLATSGTDFATLRAGDRFKVFARRITEDFGLPLPEPEDAEGWRRKAVAALLVTDAAAKCPSNVPGTDRERIIPEGAQRTNALKLLSRWQKRLDLIDSYEKLTTEADTFTGLGTWAGELADFPAALASPQAQRAVFDAEVGRLRAKTSFAELAELLGTMEERYKDSSQGFWGSVAKTGVPWNLLCELAGIARLLHQQQNADKGWKSASDAVTWFTDVGWQVDWAGEVLFREGAESNAGIAEVRTRLRQAFLHHMAQTNVTFSELLANAGKPQTGGVPLALPYAGEVIRNAVEKATAKDPVAVLVLDACRYDLGCRLAALLNEGEPVKRAKVTSAKAPVPSITSLGMAFLLPLEAQKIQVESSSADATGWQVSVEGSEGNLAHASARRLWLKRVFKLKDSSVLSLSEVADSASPGTCTVKTLGRLVFVTADELDDHDGRLKSFGCDTVLERYARVIRRLRAGGYMTVLVVTDHGFFRWEPEGDEIEAKPGGEILWASRRAVVGRGIRHATALSFGVPGSSLTCCCPRSVNSFKTYGGLGFFHGGATLQEVVIPVITMRWPRKARKVQVVLKLLPLVTSLSPNVEIAPAQVQMGMFTDVDENLTGRKVIVKIVNPADGKVLFKSASSVPVQPGGGTLAVQLTKVEGGLAAMGIDLTIQVIDADDEELLDQAKSVLKVDLDEWL